MCENAQILMVMEFKTQRNTSTLKRSDEFTLKLICFIFTMILFVWFIYFNGIDLNWFAFWFGGILKCLMCNHGWYQGKNDSILLFVLWMCRMCVCLCVCVFFIRFTQGKKGHTIAQCNLMNGKWLLNIWYALINLTRYEMYWLNIKNLNRFKCMPKAKMLIC